MDPSATVPANSPIDSRAVFEQYRDRIHGYLLKLTRQRDEADDLLQETFLRAHRQLGTLENPDAVAGWLYRIATNVFHDRLRQRTRRPELSSRGIRPEEPDWEEGWTDPEAPQIDEIFERAEMNACIREFIDGLPDDHRAALLLHDIEGFTNPEIAEVQGCTVHTVKIRLHRARKKLRDALESGCDLSNDRRGVMVCDRKPSS